jgi:glucose 1-dehydrogenase
MRVEERGQVSVGRREQRQARLVHAYCSHGAVVAPSVDEGKLSPTAAQATKRTRSPIAPGSVRLPGGGVILNCSSVHEIIPKPAYIAYSVSKGGLGNLTRTLALEYADRGIRVNGVGPGATLTDMNSAWADHPQARRSVESHIPMNRAATPAEIAAVFAFLASDDASYVTGQTIYACGGITLYGDFKNNWAS